MTDSDLDDMGKLLGDPVVMEHYPHPKSREEVQRWIDWTKNNYAEHGFGLWVLEDRVTGEFIGDCGLTMQTVDSEQVVEVGHHFLPKHQGKGLATEAARACVQYGLTEVGAPEVTAIIVPDNLASRRVAEHLGMTVAKTTHDSGGHPVLVYATSQPSSAPDQGGTPVGWGTGDHGNVRQSTANRSLEAREAIPRPMVGAKPVNAP